MGVIPAGKQVEDDIDPYADLVFLVPAPELDLFPAPPDCTWPEDSPYRPTDW